MRNVLLGSLLLLAQATSARADWASGGGEVMRDKQNPWFLKNTTTVDVCLVWDQRYFHPVDRDFDGLKTRFEESVGYWKREFAKSYVVGSARTTAVATQDFRVVSMEVVGNGLVPSPRCEAADLKVQFGYLSQEQIDFFNEKLGGVQQYLASTVRTSYDPVNLKGRGFIYLKPDSGPLSQQAPGIVPNPWGLGEGTLINYALLHELGHLFGVPHKSLESFMAVDFLERAFNVIWAEQYAGHVMYPGFFSWNRDESIRESCDVSTKRRGWKSLLKIPAEHNNLLVRFEGENRIAFYSSYQADCENPETDGPRTLLGALTYDPAKVTYMWEEAVRIYLTPEQTVITEIPDGGGFAQWVMGPMVKNEEFAGTFVSADGTFSRKMLVTTSPQALGFAGSRFSAEIDGEWYFNLDWIY